MSLVQKKEEAYFMTLLKIVESTPGLYYSYETDITLKYVPLSDCVLLNLISLGSVLYFGYHHSNLHLYLVQSFVLKKSDDVYQLAEKIQVG